MFGLSKTSFLAFVVDYIQHLEWYPRQDFMLRILLILLANKSSVINLDNYSNDLLGCFFLSCTELLLSIKSLGSSIILFSTLKKLAISQGSIETELHATFISF